MNLFSIFEISAAGMSVEQQRLAVTVSNIANARSTKSTDGAAYRPLALSVRSTSSFDETAAAVLGAGGIHAADLPRPVVRGVVESDAAPRMAYDPGHPDADERGFVSLPAVDPIGSMMELMTVSRSYEANIRAFDVTRNLIQRTIEMGNSR